MSASSAEVQELADQILALLGVRISAGQLIVHYSEGRVQRCQVNTFHNASPKRRAVDADAPSPAD
jgi:hypothetical protein